MRLTQDSYRPPSRQRDHFVITARVVEGKKGVKYEKNCQFDEIYP
jgi:hypothetical protein